MKAIKSVQMFQCPLTKKFFKTAKAAMKSASEEQARLDAIAEQQRVAAIRAEKSEEMSNYIRLNLSDINDLPKMLIEKGLEFFGLEISDVKISVGFGEISNSHACPINGVENWGRELDKPSYYMGWSGQIVATVKSKTPLSKDASTSATHYLFSRYGLGFRGFHTSCGCPGSIRPNDIYPIDIGFYFFLDDFPLLKEKYEKFKIEEEKFVSNQSASVQLQCDADRFARNHPDIVKLEKQIDDLLRVKEQLFSDHSEDYVKKNPVQFKEISSDYKALSKMFRGRWS